MADTFQTDTFQNTPGAPLAVTGRLRMAEQALTRQIAFCLRRALPLQLLAIELGQFGVFATVHGHALARRMQHRLIQEIDRLKRAEDWQCAWGDGRMVFCLPDTSAHGTTQLAQRLYQQLGQHSFRFQGEVLRFDVRIGLHCIEMDGQRQQDCRKQIMRALHTASLGAGPISLSPQMQQALRAPHAANAAPPPAIDVTETRQLRAWMRRLDEQQRLRLVDELLLASTRG